MHDRYHRVYELFCSACRLARHEQTAFLRARCGGESSLMATVELLLRNADSEASPDPLKVESINLCELIDSRRCDSALRERRSEPRYRNGAIIADRYQVLRSLTGGFSEVYLCYDLYGHQPIALKTLQETFRAVPWVRSSFMAEARVWAALGGHPNIVFCAGLCEFESRPFLLLEWVASADGGPSDLYSRLLRAPLSLKSALLIAIQICHGLLHAQEKLRPGVFHCDLKPENILLASDGTAKITDFGMAKVQGEVRSAMGGQGAMIGATATHIAGTPAYMAPELWRGERPSAPTDLYAVGCILHEMLARRPPFFASSESELRQLHEQAPIAEALDPALPPSILMLLSRCLAKCPEDRFATTASLGEALGELYQHLVGCAPPRPPKGEELPHIDYLNRACTYHQLRRYEDALVDYGRALERDPSDARVYCHRGATYFRAGFQQEAMVDLNRAIELDPQDARAYVNRSSIHADEGRLDESLADIDRAISLEPDLAEAHNNRADTLHLLGRLDEALCEQNAAISLDPGRVVYYAMRVDIYCSLNRLDEALHECNWALALDPLVPLAFAVRGGVYSLRGRQGDAKAAWERALALDPTLVRIHLKLALVLMSERGVEFAAKYLGDTWRSLHPSAGRRLLRDMTNAFSPEDNSASGWEFCGMFLHTVGARQEALACYEKAVRSGARSNRLLGNIAVLLQSLNRLVEAKHYLDYAIELNEGDFYAWYNLGTWYGRSGQYADAMRCFDRAISIRPGHEQSRQMHAQTAALWQRNSRNHND